MATSSPTIARFFAVSAHVVVAMAVAGLASGCSTQRPVLYPNPHLQSVGADQAQADINDCIALAESAGANSNRAASVAGKSAMGGAVGAAGGAAAGAVRGNAGRGAAAGAAGGAAGGLVVGLFQTRKPDSVTKRWVDTCLHERGYKTVGWQ